MIDVKIIIKSNQFRNELLETVCSLHAVFLKLYILFIYNLLSSNHMYKGESYIYFTNLCIVCILIIYRRKGGHQ